LRSVDRKDPFDSLEFDDSGSFNNEIHAVPAVQQDAPVTQWQRSLSLELHLEKPEFVCQAFLVRGLQ